MGRLTGAGGARRGRDDGRHDCERGMNDGRVGRCAACGGCGWYGRCAGRRGGCGAALCAPNIKQGCQRQPCSLSMLDSLKPIQFGFFGSLGSFFPKKLPKSGCGVKPRIYNSRTVGARGGASHIYLFPWLGCGAAPHIYLSLMSGCGAPSPADSSPLRGAEPRE